MKSICKAESCPCKALFKINHISTIKFRKRMKTNQTPAVFYKDARFWLVVAFTVGLLVFLVATYPV